MTPRRGAPLEPVQHDTGRRRGKELGAGGGTVDIEEVTVGGLQPPALVGKRTPRSQCPSHDRLDVRIPEPVGRTEGLDSEVHAWRRARFIRGTEGSANRSASITLGAMFAPPLTVLHVDSAREYRGGQNQARLLMAGLARRTNVRQSLIAHASSRLAREAADLGVDVRGVPWRAAGDPRALVAVLSGCHEDWDVVHAHDSHGVQTALVARALSGGRAPVVASRRVDFPARRPAVWQRADLVIAVSGRVRDVLVAQGVDRRRVHVVHDGIDPDELAPEADRAAPGALRAAAAAGSSRLVAAVGALVGHKDHATFIRAAARLAPRHPGVVFAVFGEGPARPYLEDLVEDLGLGGCFRLPGSVPEAARSLTDVDVFVMPSRQEGLGTACLEAMLAGRPVVATSAGGLAELAVDGGFEPVPPEDPAALAEAIARLLADPAARLAAAEAARHGAARFTARAMVDSTLACYRTLARRAS